MILLILLGFAHCMVLAEEKDSPLPADVQKAVVACDAAIAKARMEMVKGLKMSLTKTTKAGDLASANLIQAKISETEKLIDDGKALLGSKSIEPDALAGDWRVLGTDYVITVTPTKTAKWKNPTQTFTGTWTYDKKSPSLHVTWNNGSFVVLIPNADGSMTYAECTPDWSIIKETKCTRLDKP